MNNQELDSNNLNIILKGTISGFLIAYLVILGLRPTAEYPDNILEIIDNPWIFVLLIIINFYALQWDLTIGLLLMLSIIALILDVIIFTEGEIFNNDSSIENFKDETTTTTTTSGPTPSGPASQQQDPTSSQQNSEANSDSEEENPDYDLSPQQDGPIPSPKKPISINDKINNIESKQYAINSKIDDIGQKVTDIKFFQSAFNTGDNIQRGSIIEKTEKNKQKIDDNKEILSELIDKLEDIDSDDDLDETKEYIDEIAIKLTEQNDKTRGLLKTIATKLDKMNSEKQVSKRPAIKKPIRIRRKRRIK